MVNQQLVDYIRSTLAQGYSYQQIYSVLVQQGYNPNDINQSFNFIYQPNYYQQPRAPQIAPQQAAMDNAPQQVQASSSSGILHVVIVVVVLAALGSGVYLIPKMLTGQQDDDGVLLSPPSYGSDEDTIPSDTAIDCRADWDCLIEKSKICRPAKLMPETTVDLLGMVITTKQLFEISEMPESKCGLYIRTEDQDINFTEEHIQDMLAAGATQEQVEQTEKEANNQAQLVIGREGICKFKDDNLTLVLQNWKKGNFSGGASCRSIGNGWDCTSTGDLSSAECEGSMFESKS